ncbi:MAG: hypothetical protein M1820_006623 [Bogoriella megaspora]|nr:MAG: hypothetical protein M1820_006623 [Bogoriella megaspora]
MTKHAQVNHWAIPEIPRIHQAYGDDTTNRTKNTHKCHSCKRFPTQRCFEQGHVDLCEVCGKRFSVRTRQGCSDHPYHDDWNVDAKLRFNWQGLSEKKLSQLLDEWAVRRGFDPLQRRQMLGTYLAPIPEENENPENQEDDDPEQPLIGAMNRENLSNRNAATVGSHRTLLPKVLNAKLKVVKKDLLREHRRITQVDWSRKAREATTKQFKSKVLAKTEAKKAEKSAKPKAVSRHAKTNREIDSNGRKPVVKKR